MSSNEIEALRMELEEMRSRHKKEIESLKHLVGWLAWLVIEWHEIRLDAIAESPEKCKEILLAKFPLLQGFAIYNRLKALRTLDPNQVKIKDAFELIESDE